jgi:hypothetical protein
MQLLHSSCTDGGEGYSFHITNQLLFLEKRLIGKEWDKDFAGESLPLVKECIDSRFLEVVHMDMVWQRSPGFLTLHSDYSPPATFKTRKVFYFSANCYLLIRLTIRINFF